jgi:hypothetical protein
VVLVVPYHLPTSALGDLTSAQPIATRLGEEEDPPSALVDLYAGGKGLETALLAHLNEAQGRGEQIERGEHVQRLVTVARVRIGEAPAEPSRQIPSFCDDFTPKTPMPTPDDIPL